MYDKRAIESKSTSRHMDYFVSTNTFFTLHASYCTEWVTTYLTLYACMLSCVCQKGSLTPRMSSARVHHHREFVLLGTRKAVVFTRQNTQIHTHTYIHAHPCTPTWAHGGMYNKGMHGNIWCAAAQTKETARLMLWIVIKTWHMSNAHT